MPRIVKERNRLTNLLTVALSFLIFVCLGADVVRAAGCELPSFKGVRTFAVGANPNAIASADLNGDGKVDVVTADLQSGSVSILLGDGIGGFAASSYFTVNWSPNSLVIQDFNVDGKLDIAAANYTSNDVSIILGDGMGGFGTRTNFRAGSVPGALNSGDFNSDGKLDLILANTQSNTLSLLLGQATGAFSAPIAIPVGQSPGAMKTGDFNGDGRPDLAVAYPDASSLSILLGNGTGGFQAPTDYHVGLGPNSVTIEDLNMDGEADIVVSNGVSNGISILLGNGTGGFTEAHDVSAGLGADYVVIGDFNGDGKPDMAIAGGVYAQLVSVRFGDGTGSFGEEKTFRGGDSPAALAALDLNSDGKSDLAVANYWPNTVSVMLNDGTGNFIEPKMLMPAGYLSKVTVGDFNNDSNPDLAWTNENANEVSIWLGDGTGNFGAPASFGVGERPYSIATADFNLDGKADIVTANFEGNNVSVLLGDGTGHFATAKNFPALLGYPYYVRVGDFNNDGKPDVAVGSFTGEQVAIMLGDGTGKFGAPKRVTIKFGHHALAINDLNGDGKSDLAVANYVYGDVAILLGNGAGGFSAPQYYDVGDYGREPTGVTIGDFNSDTKPDLAVTSETENNVLIFIGDGTGVFAPPVNFSVGVKPASIETGDFNSDGHADLVTANNGSSDVSVLLGDGSGNFSKAVSYDVGYATEVAVADFNRDYKPDVVAASRLAILLNTCAVSSVPSISIGNVTITEGANGVTTNAVFNVSLSELSDQTITVNYETANGQATAPGDYLTKRGTLSFAPGQTSKTFAVVVRGDNSDELNETFTVNLTSAINAVISDNQGVATIKDDDSPPSLSISDVTVGEGGAAGANSAALTVALSSVSGKTVKVKYVTSDSTALAGRDYVRSSATLFFNPGEISKTINVPILDDARDETNESFLVTLQSPANATLADNRGIATINDNDAAPAISISDVTITEGNAGMTNAIFKVNLSASSSNTVSVRFATANGTASSSSDYLALSGTLSFTAGQTGKTITIQIKGDMLREVNETFKVNLNAPSNATIADGMGLGTIVNND